MAYEFDPHEIYEMAIRIEMNGAAFYCAAAGQFPDPETRAVLVELAKMEEAHQRTFERMRANLPEDAAGADGGAMDDEVARYLHAFVAGAVFDVTDDPAEFLRADVSIGEVLIEAIRRERDSILFYLGIRQMRSSKAVGDQIDAIIREEMGHITQLNDQLELMGGA
ncbi:MAG TPA: ferritin family protein [Candidatus Hydrogenedentes bacterium]|nr:ferritin family protein [Candidatus Hydrogenedentota bacterium]HPG67488.1 ferritin family protein [Candidatus Hydrogenedentota bacterium]